MGHIFDRHITATKVVVFSVYTVSLGQLHSASVVPSLRTPHGKKLSSKRSQISWAYSQKVVRINGLQDRQLLRSTSITSAKIFRVSVPFLSRICVKCFKCC